MIFAFFPLFWDPTFLLLLPAIALAVWAQGKVKRAYRDFSRVPCRAGLTGREVAARILAANGLADVAVESVNQELSDHYDPRSRVVRLSPGVHDGNSLAALAIAAHETGHAMQHGDDWLPLVLRGRLAPVAGLGSSMAFPLFFVGLIFSSFHFLMDIGIFFFLFAVLFHLVTLPVEFNASSRALAILKSDGYLATDELPGAKKVLDAAALTYVAAAAMALVNLVRLLILRGARD